MKKFLRFLFFVAVIAGVVYYLRKLGESDGTAERSGVLPSQPMKPFEEEPLGGEVSPELLRILVCPEDKGPLELVEDGKFLLNPRNGYKYPIRNGIPVMLIEEGQKHRDPSLVRSNGNPEQKESREA